MSSQEADSSIDFKVKKPGVEAASWSFMNDQPDIKYDHAFSIANFSRKMKMPFGESLSSGIFSFMVGDKETSWSIKCYPNGGGEEDLGFLSVYLIPEDNTQLPIKTECTLSIINKEGAKSVSESFENTFAKKFDYDGGHDKLISHEDLQNTDLNLLPDDVLTIHCAITVPREDESVVTSGTNRPLLSEVPAGDTEKQVSILKCVQDSYINGQFTDCVIVCNGRKFNCHKVILAGRSPVFNAMFTHDMEESRSGRLDIKDLDVDTVGKMLTYIYSDKIDNTDGKCKEEMLLAAAEKYDLPGLKSLCENALSKAMTIDNVLDMLLLADLNKAKSVKDVAINFIIENAQEIVSQEGWSKKLEKFPTILSDLFKAATKK